MDSPSWFVRTVENSGEKKWVTGNINASRTKTTIAPFIKPNIIPKILSTPPTIVPFLRADENFFLKNLLRKEAIIQTIRNVIEKEITVSVAPPSF